MALDATKKSTEGMVINLDIANAFDQVKHYFLMEVFRNFCFDEGFINGIQSCTRYSWIVLMANG